MYYASTLIYKYVHYNDKEIIIKDGQNISQIKQYQQLNNTEGWNPCIPMTVSNTWSPIKVTVTFMTNDWRNWYPLNICDYPNNKDYYKNTYLFDGIAIINNLTINNYIITDDTNYPISKSMDFEYEFIEINHGSLTNIISVISQPLFNSNCSIYGVDSSFININISDTMFHVDIDGDTNHDCYNGGHIDFTASLFQNVFAGRITSIQSTATYTSECSVIMSVVYVIYTE